MAKRKAGIRQTEIVQQFAIRLRETRQAQGLTQADLARKAHVALSHLSKLENGEAAPGLDLLDRLARALGTTVTRLLPAPTDADALTELRERTRQLFDGVVERADPDMLAALNTFLARL
jgi:transcriptional regulator with XRE-family HTH domain